jgi:GH24 family phage-related lysozyme (muramidase)
MILLKQLISGITNLKLESAGTGPWQDIAANFIAKKEGFRDRPKWDVNRNRAGYGSDKIIQNGQLLDVNDATLPISQTDALNTLKTYSILKYADQIAADLGSSNWNKLNDNQKAALTSLGYNAGKHFISVKSYGKTIKRFIDAGDLLAAGNAIYTDGPKSGGGKYYSGLEKRRKQESEMFNSGEVYDAGPGTSGVVDTDFSKVLQPISYNYNPKVKELQQQLTSKNYNIGKFGTNKDGIDGIYGPVTAAAHKASLDGKDPESFNIVKDTQPFLDVNDSVLTSNFNFHRIPAGGNNYRSAQIPVVWENSALLESVISKYGIKTIIRFNGDNHDGKHRSSHPETSIADEKAVADRLGVAFYKLSSRKKLDQVKSLLNQGNVLVHCAHGADRTGGNIGGWLLSIGWGDTAKIWKYSTQYNSWNKMCLNSPKTFSNGYLQQAQHFGVRDLRHAQQLAKNPSSAKIDGPDIETPAGKTNASTNIIIGDSQTKFVANQSSKVKMVSELTQGGKGVDWLRGQVEKYTVSPDVANVILCIGTNGGYRSSGRPEQKLFVALRKTFPNADIFVVQGSWGWGGIKNVKETTVRDYYVTQYQSRGATLIDPPIGAGDPHGNKPVYKLIGNSIDNML